MSLRRWSPLGKRLLFAAALAAAAYAREGSGDAVNQAIVWLPSGVAIAGLWLLGLGEWWVVALYTVVQRLLLGYDLGVTLPAAVGSTAEAVLGVVVLRRLGFETAFARLRDFLILLVAAATAPVASILASWIGRALFWSGAAMPFYSGWGGWWRMNALGVLVVVPAALTWLATPARPLRARRAVQAALVALGIVAAILGLIRLAPVSATGVMLLTVVLPLSLYAGVRFGPRGAASSGALAAIVVAITTSHGLGPYLSISPSERHAAIQVFELMLVAVPLVFGALIAEREAALVTGEHAEELRRSIQQALPDVTYRIRRDGLCVDLFLPAETEEPIPRSRIVGRNVRDFLQPDAAELVDRTIARVLAERAPVTVEYPLLVEGRRRIREARCVPYGDDEILAVVRDITDRKALEEQFRQSQKMEAVGKLAGGVAHDFNNLLMVIFGYADAIAHAVPAEGPIPSHVRAIRRAAERGAGLTRQLLAYSRQQLLCPKDLDLTAVVEQLGDMLRRLIGEDVRLVTCYESGDLWVRVDRSQMEQVILNLVVNARDAMPAGGELRIATSAVDLDASSASAHDGLHEGAYAALSVQDNGTGMTRDVQARAFDPFFTTKDQGKGTGLGLSMVYGIVKQSGGAVWLDSTPDSGTVVWIYLPRVAAPVETARTAESRSIEPVDATVLVVEDEPVVRELARQVLTNAGYRVLQATDGEQAIEVSRRHAGTIDLLVTDVVMPRLGGRELVRRLLAERPDVRVIFMSGYPDDAQGLGELAGPVGDFLQKPFAPSRLVEAARALLALRAVGDGSTVA
ncbi:MAG: response regulator [Acidobacteriia bacterium]|nr:response regulator [Terriglobia bacterium]